jgi:hypothetical protein
LVQSAANDRNPPFMPNAALANPEILRPRRTAGRFAQRDFTLGLRAFIDNRAHGQLFRSSERKALSIGVREQPLRVDFSQRFHYAFS